MSDQGKSFLEAAEPPVSKAWPRLKRRPFVEFRPKEIGLGFSLSADHDSERWQPNVWIHIGPFLAGIELWWPVPK